MLKRLMSIVGAALLAASLAAAPAHAKSKKEKAEALVGKAADTVVYFTHDTAFEPLWELADDAKAFVVIPRSLRGGFLVGASGGNAVMIARKEDGSWSEPVFLTIGSLSFGFQVGVEGSEIILAVMTQRGVEHLLSTSVKLGGDLSIAAGPIGGGAKAQTVDVLAFSRSRGLYGGISLEGAILKTRNSWNEGYYGAEVRPVDVIYREKVARDLSAPLQNAAWGLAHKERKAPGGEPAHIAPVQPAKVDPATGEPLPDQTYEDDAVYGAPLGPLDDN